MPCLDETQLAAGSARPGRCPHPAWPHPPAQLKGGRRPDEAGPRVEELPEKCLRHVTLVIGVLSRNSALLSSALCLAVRHVRCSARGRRSRGCGPALRVLLLCAPVGWRGAHEPGFPAGQSAAHRECGVALRHNGPGLHPDERAAAAPRAPGSGRARLSLQPVRASGER